MSPKGSPVCLLGNGNYCNEKYSSTVELQKIQDKYNELHQNFITSQESRSQQFLELKEKFRVFTIFCDFYSILETC